jgi:hypothetical protein
LLDIILSGYVVNNMKERALRFTSPRISLVSLVGCFQACLLVILDALDDRFVSVDAMQGLCIARLWLYVFSFVWIYSPLVAKIV